MEDGGGTLSSVFDFFCTLVLSLKFQGAFVPIINLIGDRFHGIDSLHKGGGDARGEVSNEDVVVGDLREGYVVLEFGNIGGEGRFKGSITLDLHPLGGEPSYCVPYGVVMFEALVKGFDEVVERSHGDGSSGQGFGSEGGGPGKGWALGHIRQYEGYLLGVRVVYIFVNFQVELDGVKPGFGFGKAAIEGFGSADTEFSGFGCHGDYGWWGNRRKDEELAWLGNWGGRRWGGDVRDG